MAKFTKWNPPKTSTSKATFSWNVSYAAFVHEGAILHSGTVIPARPWTDYGISQYPAERRFTYHFNGDFNKAFKAIAVELGEEFQDGLLAPIWQWTGVTVRRNGEVVASPRNIFDLGNLYKSYNLDFSK